MAKLGVTSSYSQPGMHVVIGDGYTRLKGRGEIIQATHGVCKGREGPEVRFGGLAAEESRVCPAARTILLHGNEKLKQQLPLCSTVSAETRMLFELSTCPELLQWFLAEVLEVMACLCSTLQIRGEAKSHSCQTVLLLSLQNLTLKIIEVTYSRPKTLPSARLGRRCSPSILSRGTALDVASTLSDPLTVMHKRTAL